jgi:ubiquinone/menaquinone biosynthesis C-methylase UbiE
MSLISDFKRTGDKKYLQEFYSSKEYVAIYKELKPLWIKKYKLICKLMKLKKGDKVLDVGCARKQLKAFLPKNIKYTGGDISTTFKPDLILDAENMKNIKDKTYDWVIFLDVLEHLPNPDKALLEAKRVSKKVILTVPNLYRGDSLTFVSRLLVDRHLTKRRPNKWVKAVKTTGLSINLMRGFYYCPSIFDFRILRSINKILESKPFQKVDNILNRHAHKSILKQLGQEIIIIAEDHGIKKK